MKSIQQHSKYTKKHHPIAMISPLVLSSLWMGFLIFNSGFMYNSLLLSPSKGETIINSLFAFIIFYGLFLLYLFWHTEHFILKPLRKN